MDDSPEPTQSTPVPADVPPPVLPTPIRRVVDSLKLLLNLPRFYTLFQTWVRGASFYDDYVASYIRPSSGDQLLDVGSGPADLVRYLSDDVDYCGLDASQRYIRSAARRYGHRRARFVCESVRNLTPATFQQFDIIVATGVLHHLKDAEAMHFFDLAHAWLKPGGRVVTLDGCYVDGQPSLTRLLLAMDRGHFVRDEARYLRLASRFRHVKSSIRTDLFRMPYTCCILECTTGSDPA